MVENAWSLPYFAQMNAQIDIFNFDQFFVPFVYSQTNHRVLLILEDVPNHVEAFDCDATMLPTDVFPYKCYIMEATNRFGRVPNNTMWKIRSLQLLKRGTTYII